MDVVSSYRVKAYCEYFHQSNFFPILLTHRWEHDVVGNFKYHDNDAQVLEENYETHRVIRLPRPKEFKIKNKWLSKGRTIQLWLEGNFDTELKNSYKVFKEFLFNHLQYNNYDLVIGVFSPHYHLKLAFEVNQNFGIPYVCDFRDLWDNRVAGENYTPSLGNVFRDLIIQRYWKKWLSKALFFTITSEPWRQKICKITKTKGIVLKNGFENFLEYDVSEKNNFLNIVYFGALYPSQNIHIFLKTISSFVKKKDFPKIKMKFIGIKERYRPGILNEIKKYLTEDILEIVPYLPKNELFKEVSDTDLLFFPAFKSIKGWCSVKVYDYLALQKPIVVCPGDGGEVDELIIKTKAGRIFNSEGELFSYLEDCCQNKKNKIRIPYLGVKEEIEKFRRENQVKEFAFYINNRLEEETGK